MIIIDAPQGSPVWLQARAGMRCASEANAMMGLDPKMPRNELIRIKATGDAKTFSEWVQKNLLDKGHSVEAMARRVLEDDLGESLFPITATTDDGQFLASSDGINMAGTKGFEHKLWNRELATWMLERHAVPEDRVYQLEQQLFVLELDEVDFVCSDGTRDNRVVVTYRSDPERRAKLLAGWAQFDKDVAAYQPQEYIPAAVANEIMALPTLVIAVHGEVISSNLKDYVARVDIVLETLPDDLVTDQDFADAKEAIKILEEGGKELERIKAHALAQTVSLGELFTAMDAAKTKMDTRRLAYAKKVEARRIKRRDEILFRGRSRVAAHVAELEAKIAPVKLPDQPDCFVAAVTNKRSLESMINAVDTEVARLKIIYDKIAVDVDGNVAFYNQSCGDHFTLFPDIATLLLKPRADLANEITVRISRHEAAEAAKKAAAPPADNPIGALPADIARPSGGGGFAMNTPQRGGIVEPVKPDDAAIINDLMQLYKARHDTVVRWILSMAIVTDAVRAGATEKLPF